MRDVDLLLKSADDKLAEIKALYERDLLAKEVSPELQMAVRQVVTDQRSALDFVTTAVAKQVGSKKQRPYFPVTTDPTKFADLLQGQLPDLAVQHPDIAAAYEASQPYHADNAALAHLPALSNDNKHTQLTPQTREERREVKFTDPNGGYLATSGNVQFGPNGVALGPGGVISFGPGGVLGFGPQGASVQGAPIDPRTQRPVPGSKVHVAETVYVDWQFDDPKVSVLSTLTGMQNAVRGAADRIRQAAGLL